MCVCEGEYKERQRGDNWIHFCLFASNALCVWLFGCVSFLTTTIVCVSVHMETQIAHLPRSGWLHSLVLGTRPDCPSANITRPKCTLSTSWCTQIHTKPMLQGTMLLCACQCSLKSCWHRQCLYTHGAFFHRPSYQFNQEMKNKLDFCAAVFAFDKWFILRKSAIKAMPAVSISGGRWLIQEPGRVPVAFYSPLQRTLLKSPVCLYWFICVYRSAFCLLQRQSARLINCLTQWCLQHFALCCHWLMKLLVSQPCVGLVILSKGFGMTRLSEPAHKRSGRALLNQHKVFYFPFFLSLPDTHVH